MFTWLRDKLLGKKRNEVIYFKDNKSAFDFVCKFFVSDFIKDYKYACLVDFVDVAPDNEYYCFIYFPHKTEPFKISAMYIGNEIIEKGDLVLYYYHDMKHINNKGYA